MTNKVLRNIASVMVAAVLLSGCAKDIEPNVPDNGGDNGSRKGNITFTSRHGEAADNPAGAPGTRTVLDDDGMTVKWTAADRLGGQLPQLLYYRPARRTPHRRWSFGHIYGRP